MTNLNQAFERLNLMRNPGPEAACVQSWTNVSAVDDTACGEGCLVPLFGDRVQDLRVDNGHRSHDPEPYLNAAATAAAIAAGLGKRPS